MPIRKCTSKGYPSRVALHNTLHPNRPVTVEAWVEADQQRKPEYKQQVWVAPQVGAGSKPAIVGYGGYDQYPFG